MCVTTNDSLVQESTKRHTHRRVRIKGDRTNAITAFQYYCATLRDQLACCLSNTLVNPKTENELD